MTIKQEVKWVNVNCSANGTKFKMQLFSLVNHKQVGLLFSFKYTES